MLKPTVVALSNVSGSGITTYGEIDVNLVIPSVRRSFAWTFVVADVVRPILGVDFLAANCLIVDCARQVLIDAHTNCKVPLNVSSSNCQSYSLDVNNVHPSAQYILSKYPNLTTPLQKINLGKSKNIKMYHHIDTGNNSPVYCRPRPLSGTKLKAARDEFDFLLNALSRDLAPHGLALCISFQKRNQIHGDHVEIFVD